MSDYENDPKKLKFNACLRFLGIKGRDAADMLGVSIAAVQHWASAKSDKKPSVVALDNLDALVTLVADWAALVTESVWHEMQHTVPVFDEESYEAFTGRCEIIPHEYLLANAAGRLAYATMQAASYSPECGFQAAEDMTSIDFPLPDEDVFRRYVAGVASWPYRCRRL